MFVLSLNNAATAAADDDGKNKFNSSNDNNNYDDDGYDDNGDDRNKNRTMDTKKNLFPIYSAQSACNKTSEHQNTQISFPTHVSLSPQTMLKIPILKGGYHHDKKQNKARKTKTNKK